MTMNKKALFLILITVIISSCSIFKRDDSTQEIQKIYVASVDKGLGADSIPAAKFHKAMNLAAMLSGKYELIPPYRIDSIYNIFEKEGENPRAIDIGRKANADKIMFAKMNRLHNMLRIDITLFSTENDEDIKNGKGYEALNFYDLKENEMLIDPSLLKATQRAFADVTDDSLMFDNLSESYRIYPAPTIVISGIAYIGMKDSTEWDIFNDRVISSYDACETILEETRKSNNFVTYDIATRDSIYAMFNLFGIENYMPPTNIEIEALRKLEVEYFISGKIKFSKNEADVNLMLFKITKAGQKMIKQTKATLYDDSTEEYRKLLRKLTNDLIDISDNKN